VVKEFQLAKNQQGKKINFESSNYELADKQTTRTVSKFIFINSSVLLIIVLAFYSYSLNLTYQWGNDDNIHYFLTLKAESYQASKRDDDLLDDEYFNFYSDYASTPAAFKAKNQEANIKEGDLLFYQSEESDNYLIPFTNGDKLSFIEHQYFFLEDEYEVAISLPQLLLLLASLVLISGLLFYFQLTKKLSQQIRGLERWTSNISADRLGQAGEEQFTPEFTEIEKVAISVQQSVSTIKKQTERESNFLKSLSHELRTPLAIVKASLELLEKSNDSLSENAKKKLGKIELANQNMCDISESLLYLWSNRVEQLESTSVDMGGLITASVDKYRHLIDNKGAAINLDFNSTTIKAPLVLTQIVVDNLIKNAFQYASQGEVQISLEEDGFSVSNSITDSDSQIFSSNTTIHEDYGYGVGLFIVESITNQLGWKLNSDQFEEKFTSKIEF